MASNNHLERITDSAVPFLSDKSTLPADVVTITKSLNVRPPMAGIYNFLTADEMDHRLMFATKLQELR